MVKKIDFFNCNSYSKLRQLQLKSLGIFIYFKEFCEKHNLMFYFCGGCCIGAVRHKGFIPWDDDIDVFMPRRDYEKLYSLWQENGDNSRYSLLRNTEEKFAGSIFTTIVDNNTTLIKPDTKDLDIPQGVSIDVFPLDGAPGGKLARSMQLFWSLIHGLYSAQIVPRNYGKLVKLVGKILLGAVPDKKTRYKISKFAESQMSKHKIENCENITELCAGPKYMRNQYPKIIFSSSIYEEFEGMKMPIPIGYDRYLKIAFGDYMAVPPKEKQISHHDVVFMDLEKSYKEYSKNFSKQ
ncbi:MAG: LicD family protein [Oscillospiraceae bacterium]|nr:LicD family protein [Oscillospiraceae bacterium]